MSVSTTPVTMVNTNSPRPGGTISGFPQTPLAAAHNSVIAQTTQIILPTQFAFAEATTSPRTRRAKLVVIPHDGHGLPMSTAKLHGGMPNCVCVDIVRGFPSSSYG